MNKLLTGLLACAFGLAISSTVIAADEMAVEKSTSPQPAQTAPQAAPKDKQAEVVKDKANKPEDLGDAYAAELKKCDALTGSEKQACQDKIRGAHGKM